MFLALSYLDMTYSYKNWRKVRLKEEAELIQKTQLVIGTYVSPVYDSELCDVSLILKMSVPNNA